MIWRSLAILLWMGGRSLAILLWIGRLVEGLSFLLAILLWLGRLPLSLLFFSPPRSPGTLDVAVCEHEGPTARTRTLSRELGCIPCPKSSDSKTTRFRVSRPWTGRSLLVHVLPWLPRGAFPEAGDERVFTDPPEQAVLKLGKNRAT